jgi:hypothetical protein
MVLVLVVGLLLGGIARMQRQARERERLVAELAREHVYVDHAEPTLLCLVLMKVLSTHSRDAESRCSEWIGPGWFSYPKGFNAGRLKEDQVPLVVGRLKQLGTVWEVTYTDPSLKGLKSFYIDRVPYGQLGPEGSTCTFKRHPSSVSGE